MVDLPWVNLGSEHDARSHVPATARAGSRNTAPAIGTGPARVPRRDLCKTPLVLDRIRTRGFKSLLDVELRLAPLIAKLLASIAGKEDRQVVVTTHSPTFVSAMLEMKREQPELIELVRCVQDGRATRVEPFADPLPLVENREIRDAEQPVLTDEMEIAPDIVREIDLYRAEDAQPSLGAFIQDVQAALKMVQSSRRGS